MKEDRAQRRLAAILAADVVGYSRLMGDDDESTLNALTAHTVEHIEPCVSNHRGRIFKTTGDGLLAEFASVVDAVACAIAFQEGMKDRNAGSQASPRIEFRIGINLGDIIVQNDDVFGDGVNIAARLEGLCEPGQVYVSGTVYDHADGKIPAAFANLGEHTVKNISKPVRVYRVGPPAAATTETPPAPDTGAATPGRVQSNHDKPSVAVLAFDNMSGDPEQAYFADGISEDIITDLSKVSGLFVIGRNSSFAYRGKSQDLRQICSELNVRYIVEGSVRKAGNRVRINAQMIDGATGGHVWAERYDRELADIFAVQDEVTREIVGALEVALTDGEQSRRLGRRRVDPEAYDLFIQGRDRLHRFTVLALLESRALLERAIELDPSLSPAYAYLALSYGTEYFNGWNGATRDALLKGLAIAEQACEIDPAEPYAHHALSIISLWLGRFDVSETAAARAVELNPNYAGGHAALGQVRDLTGNHRGAIESAEKVLMLDPHYDVALQLLGRAQFALGDDDQAKANFEERIRRRPRSDTSRAFLIAIQGHAGETEEALRIWEEIMGINPEFSISRLKSVLNYRSPAVMDRLMDGFRKAGLS